MNHIPPPVLMNLTMHNNAMKLETGESITFVVLLFIFSLGLFLWMRKP